ncbi:peptide deformylase [Olsenella sp. Marseille-QA0557]|uniref:Peptide deformylase n=1 Tax=Candidatus Coprovicinus avistercoris TaxID=2840754 RepID=A0A9D1L574_9ACTN|nr:peptide deformylase [Candidatus Coprovicinus avistercoris]
MIKELISDEEVLSKPAEPAGVEDADLVQDLLDTMASLDDCACLAANQIGVAKAVIVYQTDKHPHVMLNPKLVAMVKPYMAMEGCLSLKRETPVKRFQLIRVSYDTIVDGKLVSQTRKFTGWTAEIIQHGIDHCAGVLV